VKTVVGLPCSLTRNPEKPINNTDRPKGGTMNLTATKLKTATKRTAIVAVVAAQFVFSPLVLINTGHVYADDSSDSSSTTSSTGETAPTGADAYTYHYNETTGLWENDYYTWNPATKQTSPKAPQEYSWNPVTKRWETKEWIFDAASGKYVPNTITTGGTVSPDGQVAPTDSISNTGPNSNNTTNEGGTINGTGPNSNNQTNNGGSISNTGPSSNNQTANKNNATGAYDLFYNANISGNVYQSATSGDVNLSGNTSAGNGASGMASSMANVINLLQSAWGLGGDVSTFNLDINGDVYGDMSIDPNKMTGNLGDASTNNADRDLTVNSTSTAHMTNDIDVNATSGDVNASQNTSVGDAKSGDAKAIANVVNLINSYITVGKSFIGSINIYGNYNGDILIPEDMMQALLASNAPRVTVNTDDLDGSTTTVNNDTKQSINNNATASASTGDVNVSGNSKAGNGTSGKASTNITVLNLTGQQFIGKNALLVFVNVMGSWVGMIVNAPGSTAAALGGADTTIGNTSMDIDSQTTNIIDNDINVHAQTGDVDVTQNTKAGNGTSGDAQAGINLANITNSGFSLSNWFGVLFINVFGNWIGSFGVNTAAGNSPHATPVSTTTTGAGTPGVFSFNPTVVNRAFGAATGGSSTSTASSEDTPPQGVVLAATTTKKASNVGSQGSQSGFQLSAIWPVALLALFAAGATEVVARIRAAHKK
jgi:hypothetical protein